MKTITSATAFTALSLLLSVPLFSQETNKNDARSYHSRGMSIFFSPVYNSPMDKGTDSLLFRGSGAGIKFGGDYFFGNVGLGLVSGFSSSAADDALINDFLKRNSIPQDLLVINKSSQQSMYLLIGPSLRWGKSVQLFAHAKGGLFINNGGLVNIQQKGAQRSIYRNEATTKSIYPGFQTGMSIQYSNKAETWSFGFGADYMCTKTQMQNFDLRRGSGVEGLKLSRNISDLMAGISIRYTIKSPRDAASGQATGRRTRDAASGLPTGRRSTMANRDASSGLATGRRTRDASSGLATGRRTRDAASGLPTGRRSAETVTEEVIISDVVEIAEPGANCGPVTQRVTNPDGTTSEMTFACPDDAAAYLRNINGGMPNRISMNVTVPKQTQGATFGEKVNQGLQVPGGTNAGKQTQGATFGEKVNQGLHAAGGALAQGKNIISGNISWATEGSTGIVTNKTVTKLAGGPGGAAQASYAATGMVVSNPSPGIGSVLTLYSREAGSGMASGRRDKGSGMATGRRQYQPLYQEGNGNACDTCSTSVRLSGVQNNPYFAGNDLAGENVEMANGHNNPMYNENQNAGSMVKSSSGNTDQDCDGLAGVDVLLKDPRTGAIVARTTTGACGDFFFANVPDGDYLVVLAAALLSKKSYDMYNATASDMRGSVQSSQTALQLFLNTGGKEEEPVQKAGISTSRSNIRNKTLTIIEADTDGDGDYEALRATATFSDGSSADISSSVKKSATSGAAPSLTIDEAGTQRRRVEVLKSNKTGDPNANRLTGISVTGSGSSFKAMAIFSNGSKKDITESVEVNTSHNGLRQYSVTVADLDGDGHVDGVLRTRTKSNQTNERMAAGDEEIWSPRSNIKTIPVITGDLDGDGEAELIGGALPGGAVISAAVSRQTGGPIGGIIVKGGKNPGGQMRTMTTDENGMFEFTGLEAGSYTFTTEQKLFIDDVTFVSVGGSRAQDHNSSRSNKTASGVAPDPGSGGGGSGGSKAQDHNSSRSNKSSSVAPDPGSGGGGSGGSKAQDHNSTRSNKTASVIDNELDNGDGSFRKGDVKVTASQNTQSLRTISVQADLDGDGVYETDVTSKISDELLLDKEGNLTEPQQKTGISTSRSNIRNRSSLQPVTQTVFTGYGTTTINGKEVEVKTVYKVVEKATSGLKDTLKTQVSIRPAEKYSPTV